jgi:ABC-2 type transport system permease protein
MLSKLLKFELSVHLRQISFWVAFAVMLGIGIAFASLENFSIGTGAGSKVKGNGAIPIALTVSAFGLFSIFFSAVFVVTGVMRDETYKFMEIIHSTKVKTIDLIVSRMIGVWIATVLSLIGIVIGTMAGQFMPWADSETFQSFNILHFLQPTILFIVINALLVSSIYTLIAVSTRNKAFVYVSAVGLFVLYIIAGIIAGENPDEWLAALIDPFGGTSLALETQYWPAAEQNNKMAPLEGWLGFNRLIYLALSLFIFSTAYKLSVRGFKNGKIKSKKNENENKKISTHISPIKPNLGRIYSLKSFWLRIIFEYKSTVKTTAFIILFAIALVLFGITLFASLYLGASTSLPTSNLMTELAIGSMLIPLVIIMVFFGSDLMWRDRTSNIHGILDATPVKNSTLLFAKWGALALLIFTLILGLLVAGMIAQLIFGWGNIPVVPSTFLAIGLVSFFTTFFFQGMLVMFIQNFMPGRIIGMFVGAGALVSLIFVIGNLPFYHPLMNYGSISAGAYSEMGGFSAPKSYGWEFAYWAGFLLILGAISTWIWRRGYQVSLAGRLRSIRGNLTAYSLSAAVLGVSLFLGFGVLGSQSYTAEEYVNSNQVEKIRAEFEKSVIDIWQEIEPRITKVSVLADFFSGKPNSYF